MTSPRWARLVAATMLGIAMLAGTVRARATEPDPWFGSDKLLHFGVSAGIAVTSYGGFSLVLDEPWQRGASAASLTLAAGAGKELYDLGGRGDASWKDFAWDVVGTAVGVGVALAVDSLVGTRERRRREVIQPLALRW